MNWEALQDAWRQNEIRLGNDVQLSLLTDAPIAGTLDDRLSSDSNSALLLSRSNQGESPGHPDRE